MKPEEELAQQFLLVNHLRINRFDHNSKHRRVLETEILEFHLSLG